MCKPGNLSALHAAMMAHLKNKAKVEKQQRKNPSPTKKAGSVVSSQDSTDILDPDNTGDAV